MISEFRGETRWLSNFHKCPIYYEGIVYPSTEHAYHAAKTLDIEARKIIAALPSPGAAKYLGMKIPLRPNWDSIKLEIMTNLNRQKFQGDLELAARLLSTGNQELVEGNNWGDTYWGVCDGIGGNNLGKILMKIREELRCA